MILCGSSVQTTGQRAKTKMNESKYSVNGMSQISGTGERSVVICVVTPSIMLDGTAARPIHLSRRSIVTSSASDTRIDGLASVGAVATGALAVMAVSTAGLSATAGAGGDSGLACVSSVPCPRTGAGVHTNRMHTYTLTAKRTKPPVQMSAWLCSTKFGPMTAGYISSPSMLPRLLAP